MLADMGHTYNYTDTLALFGSAALMIQKGIEIYDNGSFVEPKEMNEPRFDVWFDELLEEPEFGF